jgi:MSHA pilin protein MshC
MQAFFPAAASDGDTVLDKGKMMPHDYPPKRMAGFTLIEMIVTLVMIGILAAFAAPRFFGNHGFEERGFHDEVLFALRFAQKVAIAQRRLVCVQFPDNKTVRLRISSAYPAAACDTDLAGPDGTTPYTISATANTKYRNADVTLSPVPATVSFDPLGKPNAAATVSVANFPTAITVAAETGYVY